MVQIKTELTIMEQLRYTSVPRTIITSAWLSFFRMALTQTKLEIIDPRRCKPLLITIVLSA